jgi:glutamate synthase domain-containing protein 2/glutamate synthase domain-containing protein 1/glutamate synthase domain-containing protein 3
VTQADQTVRPSGVQSSIEAGIPIAGRPDAATARRIAPMYDFGAEHDNCGVGLVVDIAGSPARRILDLGLQGLVDLTHRGGVGADPRTGDGAGVLTQVPLKLFAADLERLGHDPATFDPGDLGVAVTFLPADEGLVAAGRTAVEAGMAELGLPMIGWREVAVDPSVLGNTAATSRPEIAQALIRRPEGYSVERFERELMLARRAAERAAAVAGIDGFAITSCSARTIVYKGFCLPKDLPRFYADLNAPEYETAIVLFHQRYSTNTFPTWALAQPFRFLAHNGEINTVTGNRLWMQARKHALELSGDGQTFGREALEPVISMDGSDSFSLDNTLELLFHGGRSLPHALMMLVPEPWEQLPEMPADLRAFYDFHAGLVEQWDGPAALAFSDGVFAGATLDRNGLRPSRWARTSDGLFIAGSEAGTVKVDPTTIVEKGRLGPGQMILVDTSRGVILHNDEIKAGVASKAPWAEWLREHRVLPPAETKAAAPKLVAAAPAGDEDPIAKAKARAQAMRAARAAAAAEGAELPTPDKLTAAGVPKTDGPSAAGIPAVGTKAAPAGGDRSGASRPMRTKADPETLAAQRAFGYTAEDIRLIVQPMAAESKEPTWSMGDDAPLAVLSDRIRPLSSYFRQRFAQVTNPAIDSLRERKVMALDAYVGPRGNLLAQTPEAARLLHLPSAVIGERTFDLITGFDGSNGLKSATVSTLWPVAEGDGALATALDRVLAEAVAAIEAGAGIIVLSDRGVSATHAPLPMLLVVGALHHHLIREGLRNRADLVCAAGEVWDVHQFATLVGYGASAVFPYLALEAGAAFAGQRGYESVDADGMKANYLKALEYGFLKVTSKIGISTAAGYRGAQIFETIGLAQDVVDRYFTGTPCRLSGIGLPEIEQDVRARHAVAYPAEGSGGDRLADQGLVRFRKEGEAHAWSPSIVTAIQNAVNGDRAAYDSYRQLVREQPATTVRDLLDIRPLGDPVPLDEVESAQSLYQRFVVTAMSLGSLSPEAYRTLAIAMNRLGARSNSGEGGEDPEWYEEARRGPDIPHSKVKQVASGRFGVTATYLSLAEELEIKIAQGAKPGEGGQLPGHKVTPFIAKLRYAVPGGQLISPPPHHDIYSIEDLAQLIYDLRQVNPRAKIGVKLVSEAGIGTIAAGVAKARADYILVSGHSGGTGAAPLASIKHAGSPWELGLAEVQQTLVLNRLRSRVRLRTDGGIKTPDDVIVAALLGAEEFGFGTSVLVAIGCDMARQCHLNTCPTGIATQREDLRAKYTGTPENVIAWFEHLATGLREAMAAMGARSIDDLVGRTDLLAPRQRAGRAGMLDVSQLIAEPAPVDQRRRTEDVDHVIPTLDNDILDEIRPALAAGDSVEVRRTVTTEDRTVGARIAGELALKRHHGEASTARVTAHLRGSAGQSFGAFTVPGMLLSLEGEANDYTGKGMSGGEVAVFPPVDAAFERDATGAPQTISGNTNLYGATGGALFLAGGAGERFAVRNSGATAVVEGVGDHGCEYMTGGRVVVLGPTGRNFGAGMTEGLVWVLDEDGGFAARTNAESVVLEPVAEGDDDEVRGLIERHLQMTGSRRARALLADWDGTRSRLKKVVPTAAIELARQRAAEAAAREAEESAVPAD